PLGRRRCLADIIVAAVFSGCFRKRQCHIVGFEGSQQKSPAPRADGRQFTARGMTDEKNERSLRWLLPHLQQCVCPFTLKIVDRINDGDAPSPLTRSRAEKRYCTANVVNSNDRVELVRLLVEGALEHQ